MRLRSASSWLLTTFGGCLSTAWVGGTVLAIFGPTEPLLGNRFWNWVISMLFATAIAVVAGISLCVADVLFVRWREIPTGGRAFVLSSVTPMLVLVAYSFHKPASHGTVLGWILAALLPIVALAFATRLLLGKRRSDA